MVIAILIQKGIVADDEERTKSFIKSHERFIDAVFSQGEGRIVGRLA